MLNLVLLIKAVHSQDATWVGEVSRTLTLQGALKREQEFFARCELLQWRVAPQVRYALSPKISNRELEDHAGTSSK